MPRLLSAVLALRHDPRLVKAPPYLSLLCVFVGIVSLLILPLDGNSRRTYISENALLPGQVHTYFGGSDQHVFRAYRHELDAVVNGTNIEINDKLASILKPTGLKVGRQPFTYRSSGSTHSGENLYAILQAPRGDATEAIVLIAAYKNAAGELNRNGVALALALARYFRRWSLWSKDIILLFPPDSLAGPHAWVDAYHDAHDPRSVAALPIKSGALQGALALDLAREGHFESIHIAYDGVNGMLPNLDLINSVVNIAGGQMGMGTAMQELWDRKDADAYGDRLQMMARGMVRQAAGAASGPHSAFMAYHVDAVTLAPFGNGWQDEMAAGRVVEATFRSLNNLLEHLHQSFFFYLLMGRERFVSIGTYLPSAMLVAASFSIMAIATWIKSGRVSGADKAETKGSGPGTGGERHLFLPLAVLGLCHLAGLVPLYVFNHLPANLLAPTFTLFTLLSALLPHVLSNALITSFRPTTQQYQLVKTFSLLLLGMFLSSLATLNFSLSFLVGILASPLSFVSPSSSPAGRYGVAVLLNLVAPPAVLLACAGWWGMDLAEALRVAAFGWDVWGMWTAVVVWCVWWPAWLVGSLVALGEEGEKVKRA